MDINQIKEKLNEVKMKLMGENFLVEVRLRSLLDSASSVIKGRAEGYNVSYRLRLFKKDKNNFYFYVKKPGGKRYRVNFQFQGNDTEDMINDDVKVSCTCGYWKWFGPDWNAIQNNYKLRRMSDGSPPDIRDPQRENYICKHVYAAGKVLNDYLKTFSW